MFKIDTAPRFTHAVTVMVPTDGGHERQTFKATFGVLAPEVEAGFDLGSIEGTIGFLKGVVHGMDELVDQQNQPVGYNDQVRDQLLALPFVRNGLTRAYYRAMQKAPEGN